MATSKNQKSGTKGKNNFVAEKNIRPKKEYILVEQTIENIGKVTTVEKDGELIALYGEKIIECCIVRYGKKYFKVRNT